MKLSENPVFHDKSKHIDLKYHYIRDMVQKGAVRLQYIPTDQIAYILTKPLSKQKFEHFRDKLGVVCPREGGRLCFRASGRQTPPSGQGRVAWYLVL